MVWPLLLGGAYVASQFGLTDSAGDLAADAIESTASVIGKSLVGAVEGTYDAIEESVEGRGAEVATVLTCIFLAWATYHAARSALTRGQI